MLLHDTKLDLGAEGADKALNRPRRRVAQRADSVPLVRIRPGLRPGLGLGWGFRVRVRVTVGDRVRVTVGVAPGG